MSRVTIAIKTESSSMLTLFPPLHLFLPERSILMLIIQTNQQWKMHDDRRNNKSLKRTIETTKGKRNHVHILGRSVIP